MNERHGSTRGGTGAAVRLAVHEPQLDVEHTFAFQRNGVRDPTASVGEHGFAKTFAQADGAIVRHAIRRDGDALVFEAVGEDASLAFWSAQFPLTDGFAEFTPQSRHFTLRHVVRRYPAVRIVAVPWLFDLACSIVLQQRVTYEEAMDQWVAIVARHGMHGALGPAFPTPRMLSRRRPAELEALGIDRQRAATLVRLATVVAAEDLFAQPDAAQLVRRLAAISGIGPWTVGMLAGFGLGDPDAVPMGDLHLPHLVARVFTDRSRGSDAQILALLAPYAGQRFRVIKLLWTALFDEPALLHRR